jgi:hypothetical protein
MVVIIKDKGDLHNLKPCFCPEPNIKDGICIYCNGERKDYFLGNKKLFKKRVKK